MTTQTQTHRFEAEVQEVLNLVIHSLYTNREIFLRELISNSSDALDRLRFEALTQSDLMGEGETLGIALSTEPEDRTLCIADNGIGMDRDELVRNLGTIANSGTRRFAAALAESQDKQADSPELIGQFGVGFYSAFMIAERVTVETRKAGSDQGWRWTSAGDGEYAIEEVADLPRGTVVRLSVRPGEEYDEFLKEWKIREVVRRYSDFVEYPIQMEVERTEPARDDEGELIEGADPVVTRETETLNSQKPLWARPKNEIEKSDYDEFYKHLTHDWKDPFEVIHFNVEGTLEYTALLYLPQERSMDLMDPSQRESKISLYARRVLIQAECEGLLPNWLRFVRGVVETSDLPLNVSRETLQDNPQLKQIQKRLVRKVLDTAADLMESKREDYETFWNAFGLILKEGIYHGEDEDQRLSKLCLFHSTHGEGWTSLAEYVERMPEGQEAIYTISGPAMKTLETSPHLESLRAKGYEVLFLTDPVDEWIQPRMTEFDGKPIRSVEKGDIDVEDEKQKEDREKQQEEHKGLLESMRDQLSEQLSEVRFSGRLKESPAVLVSAEQGLSPQLARMLRSTGQEIPEQKRILELNAEHPIVRGLKKLHDLDPKTPRLGEVTELLYGQALLGEGSELADPSRFSKLLTELLLESVTGKGQ